MRLTNPNQFEQIRRREGMRAADIWDTDTFEDIEAEIEKKKSFQTTDWARLQREGSVSGAEEWHYHPGGQFLLNGSLSAPGTSPTRLSLDEIRKAVRVGLNPKIVAGFRALAQKRFTPENH